jgi:rsbT co-antagonist protein RsbR
MLGIFAIGALILFSASFGYARSILANLKHLITSADEIAAGNYTHRIAIRSNDEVARIALSFNHMATNVEERQEQVLQQQQTIEQRAGELEQRLAELRQTIGERDQLHDAIRELSSPVLPISQGILAMPLIGVIDTQRAALMTQTLLAAIERHRATIVILDVTGVPIIDTQVARVLLQAAEAAKLLGAGTILTGIRPELAQTIVGLGVDLSNVATQANLQIGITYAFQRHRIQAQGIAAIV